MRLLPREYCRPLSVNLSRARAFKTIRNGQRDPLCRHARSSTRRYSTNQRAYVIERARPRNIKHGRGGFSVLRGGDEVDGRFVYERVDRRRADAFVRPPSRHT